MARYLVAVLAVAAATAVTYFIYDWVEPSISLLFFPAVLVPAIYGGYGPAFVATILSTVSLAYFFVPPRTSFDIGLDDGIRLAAFAAVSFATAWLGLARRRAEQGRRESMQDLRSAVDTLKDVSGWPVVVGPDLHASVRTVLSHAARALHGSMVVAVWEHDEEPWVYVASSGDEQTRIAKHSAANLGPFVDVSLEKLTFLAVNPQGHASVVMNTDRPAEWVGVALPPTFPANLPPGPLISARFRTEHLTGRVFVAGMLNASVKSLPAADAVSREVGNSLDQIYLAEGARDVAVREDRLRVARDLHDGVLQSLTGVRLELQSIADETNAENGLHARLLAIERAVAIEQRELRLFIEQLKPETRAGTSGDKDAISARLEEMCSRLSVEWRVPITLRMTRADIALPETIRQPLRLMIHEAVVNALKHGHPSRVRVAIDTRADEIQVTVTDDGRGFAVLGPFDDDALASVGPASLRDRVTALDGQLHIESTAAGSRVDFSIPLAKPEA